MALVTFNSTGTSPLLLTDLDANFAGFADGSLITVNRTLWTPTLTFATSGDLNVVYSTRYGQALKIGKLVILNFRIVTSGFAHSTAAGNLTITGNPYTPSTVDASAVWDGNVAWGGITKVNYTQVSPSVSAVGGTNVIFTICGSAQAAANVTTADVPSGGTVVLRGTIQFWTA